MAGFSLVSSSDCESLLGDDGGVYLVEVVVFEVRTGGFSSKSINFLMCDLELFSSYLSEIKLD